jgi:nucleoside-diphosphate-sugar epimerase
MAPYTAAAKTKNILIIGSTGTIGTYITRAIVEARENFERICILTSEKTLMQKVQDIAALEAWGLEIFTGRLESESAVKRAYEGMLHMGCKLAAGIASGRDTYYEILTRWTQALTRSSLVLVELGSRNKST